MSQTTNIRYVRYLPAIFQEVPSILRDYLGPFEDWFDQLRDQLTRIDTYMTPTMTPAPGFLPWLASWVALTLDEEWSEDQRRRLISQAVELYRWRGTATGLRRYLALYTDLQAECIEIHEARWPSGMQIGVTSRIGGVAGGEPPAQVKRARRLEPTVERDYYVITTAEEVRYIPVEKVASVEFKDDKVLLHRTDAPPEEYPQTVFTRRNGLAHTRFTLTPPPGAGGPVTYHGDGCCIAETPRPYSFIVRVLVPPAKYDDFAEPSKLSKLKTIVELEKPAHTACYLDLQRERKRPHILPMQIGVTSTIGLDTTVPIRGDKEHI